jgi:copper oxidase (laccase) domain-containing protein
MADLEFDLAQSWAKDLRIVFEDRESSARFNVKVALHVEQVHGNEIYEVGPADLTRVSPVAKADGLLARGEWFKACKRPLLIKTADCVPLAYVDREAQAVCLVHAGWRGLAQGIHLKPFDQGWFTPKTTWCWVGPSLNGENFEVGEDLVQAFPAHRDVPGIFTPRAGVPGKWNFSPWKLIDHDFRQRGVELAYNVETDTFTDTKYASHRRAQRDGTERGNNYAWMRFF